MTGAICQSCAMPLSKEEEVGTNADNSKNSEYCIYCYKDGAFTDDCTMDEMIEGCIPHVSKGNPYPNETVAKSALKELFPKLKRWQ